MESSVEPFAETIKGTTANRDNGTCFPSRAFMDFRETVEARKGLILGQAATKKLDSGRLKLRFIPGKPFGDVVGCGLK